MGNALPRVCGGSKHTGPKKPRAEQKNSIARARKLAHDATRQHTIEVFQSYIVARESLEVRL